MKLWVSLILALVVLVLDFATKRWVESELLYREQVPVTSFFNLVLTYNAGAAFSFLSDAAGWQRWFFSGIAGGASILIIYLLRKHAADKLFCIALSLILGGAVGNLWDRITLGHVVDFLDFYIGSYHWPAFNVADSAIFVGAMLLILQSFLQNESSRESEPQKK
jgi:signal peptidase II